MQVGDILSRNNWIPLYLRCTSGPLPPLAGECCSFRCLSGHLKVSLWIILDIAWIIAQNWCRKRMLEPQHQEVEVKGTRVGPGRLAPRPQFPWPSLESSLHGTLRSRGRACPLCVWGQPGGRRGGLGVGGMCFGISRASKSCICLTLGKSAFLYNIECPQMDRHALLFSPWWWGWGLLHLAILPSAI